MQSHQLGLAQDGDVGCILISESLARPYVLRCLRAVRVGGPGAMHVSDGDLMKGQSATSGSGL
jgi:hypothetical protein